MEPALSFFTELAFPIAVAAFLLVITTRKLERLHTDQLKLLIFTCLLLDKADIDVPDTKLRAAIELLKVEEKEGK